MKRKEKIKNPTKIKQNQSKQIELSKNFVFYKISSSYKFRKKNF